MPKFLNRLLALPIAEQNQFFAELEERIAANIEQAIEAGSYEVGVETVIADSIAVAGRETLYEHPGTGAATELVEIVRRDKLDPTTAESALAIGAHDPAPDSPPRTGSGGKPRLVVNTRSQRAAVVLPAPSRMFDDGGVQERVRLLRPATRESIARAELEASNWRRADEAHWRMLWDHEIGVLPTHRESPLAATRLSATDAGILEARDAKVLRQAGMVQKQSGTRKRRVLRRARATMVHLEGAQIDAFDRLDHEVRQIIRRDPVPQIGRKQKRLVPITVHEVAHPAILREIQPKVRQTASHDPLRARSSTVRIPNLIVESSAVVGYGRVEAMASIRDILSICVVARARARHIQNKGGNRVFYSRSFDFYQPVD